MYCRKCYYDLRGLPEPRCPECGTSFDPQNAATFSRAPSPQRLRNLFRQATTTIKESARLPHFPEDPQAARIARLSRKVAELSVENEKLWDNVLWVLGLMIEKDILTEEDIQNRLRRNAGTLPTEAGRGPFEVIDDTIEDPEPEPSDDLLNLGRVASEQQNKKIATDGHR
jgi:hypothetical protein